MRENTTTAVLNAPGPAAPAERDRRERELLLRVVRRERAAFETLYRDYHGRLGRFLARFTQRHDLVDEVINDTLWIVWNKAPEFRGGSQVSTWIMGIAYRCTLKALRRAGTAEVPLTEADHATEEPALLQEERDWILRGLGYLPLDQQMTLQLAYYLGHSGEEIAEIMDCPLSTVKARMFHARVKLRSLLPALGGMQAGSGASRHE